MKKESIILVHGLWEIPLNLRFWGYHLKKVGYDVKYFKYRSVFGGISENTEKLFEFLKKIDSECLHLVGHSLGGLIVLNLLDRYSVDNIRYSVLLGTPAKGSIVCREMGKTNLGKRLFGKSFDLLCCGSRPLCEHKIGKVGVVAGFGGKGLGQFFADLSKPHDGAVSVQETQLLGAGDSVCSSSSHFTMLFSKRVALQIAEFCGKGKFLPN